MVFLGGLLVVLVVVVVVSRWVRQNIIWPELRYMQVTPTPTMGVNEKKYERPTTFRSETVLSPDGNYVVYLMGFKSDGMWKINLGITGQNSGYTTELQGSNNLNWAVGNNDAAWEYYQNFTAGWSRDSRKLVAVVNGWVYRWDFRQEKVTTGNGEMKITRHVLRTIKSDIKRVVDQSMVSAPETIIFPGGDKVYLGSQDGLYQIFPEEQLVQTDEKVSAGEFWPLPNEDGYVYLNELKKYGSYDLVVVRNGVKREYPTPLSGGADYAGQIVMSPDYGHVCLEIGSSGYHGYNIFKLGEKENLIQGQQYSWCERWLNNYSVVVREKSYFSQWNEQFYIIDVRTKERTLVGDWEDRSF